MSRNVNNGKSEQILHFIRQFTAVRGFGPTIREIGDAVGLKSSSTVYNYLSRMTKRGLVASEPGKPRSLHVLEPRLEDDPCDDGGAVLSCKFRFPNGTYPVSVIAMVADDDKQFTPVKADQVEVLRMKPAATKKAGISPFLVLQRLRSIVAKEHRPAVGLREVLANGHRGGQCMLGGWLPPHKPQDEPCD